MKVNVLEEKRIILITNHFYISANLNIFLRTIRIGIVVSVDEEDFSVSDGDVVNYIVNVVKDRFLAFVTAIQDFGMGNNLYFDSIRIVYLYIVSTASDADIEDVDNDLFSVDNV